MVAPLPIVGAASRLEIILKIIFRIILKIGYRIVKYSTRLSHGYVWVAERKILNKIFNIIFNIISSVATQNVEKIT